MPKLDAIGIVVKNLDESRRFYRLIGVDIPEVDEDHVEVVLENGLRLMFDKLELVQKIMKWEEPVGHRMGLAFLCSSPADVDVTVEKIRAEGFKVSLEPWDAFWGQRYAQVVDPDGNLIDLFAPIE